LNPFLKALLTGTVWGLAAAVAFYYGLMILCKIGG